MEGIAMKLSEIVREVISMARAANAARMTSSEVDWPVVTSGSIQPIESSGSGRQAHKPRPVEVTRLREFLEGQPAGVVYLLTAIMYLGRGDFRVGELMDEFADMAETFGSPKLAAKQMLEKVP